MKKTLLLLSLTAAAGLFATAAAAQDWVQFKQQGADVFDYRVAERRDGGQVIAVVRHRCELFMKEETRSCAAALETRRAFYAVMDAAAVTYDKPQPDAYRVFWAVATLAVNCGGPSFRVTVEEFYDVKVQLVMRVEAPTDELKIVHNDPDMAYVAKRVCS